MEKDESNAMMEVLDATKKLNLVENEPVKSKAVEREQEEVRWNRCVYVFEPSKKPNCVITLHTTMGIFCVFCFCFVLFEKNTDFKSAKNIH
jgi:hypothetical protein